MLHSGLKIGPIGAVLFCLLLAGCEDKDAEAAAEEPASETVEQPEPIETKSADELLAEERAAAEAAKKEAERATEQTKVDDNPLTECCRALGRKGFTERSPEYTAAAKSCGESMEADETADKAMPGIKKSLKGNALPSECSE